MWHGSWVLVNDKRRHRSSVIFWWAAGVITEGAQGPDTSVLPTAAIKTVEVTHNGAVSQYGSDALADVINCNLKDTSEDGSILVKAGEYSESDGDMTFVSGNFGLPLEANGFVNFGADFGNNTEMYDYANPTTKMIDDFILP